MFNVLLTAAGVVGLFSPAPGLLATSGPLAVPVEASAPACLSAGGSGSLTLAGATVGRYSVILGADAAAPAPDAVEDAALNRLLAWANDPPPFALIAPEDSVVPVSASEFQSFTFPGWNYGQTITATFSDGTPCAWAVAWGRSSRGAGQAARLEALVCGKGDDGGPVQRLAGFYQRAGQVVSVSEKKTCQR